MDNIWTNKNLKVGDRVEIDCFVCNWHKCDDNPRDVKGTVESIIRYYHSNEIYVYWDNGDRSRHNLSDSDLILVSYKQEAMNGINTSWFEKGGFPPAGTVCEAEYDSDREEWNKVRVIGYDNGECVFRWLSGKGDGSISNYSDLDSFRPIREPSKEELIVERFRGQPDVSGSARTAAGWFRRI